jgi:uncharacterized protein (TIGR03435 family)
MNRPGPFGFLLGAVAVLSLSTQWGFAQSASPANFEVASLTPNASMGSSPVEKWELDLDRAVASNSQHGRFRIKGITLSSLIQLAYSVRDFQLQGAPSWANSDRYDIDAKAASDASLDEMRPMLQSLLTERFKLTLHREIKELPVYELVVARAGLKITTAKDGSCVTRPANTPPAMLSGPRGRFCGGVGRNIISDWPQQIDRIDAIGISMPRLIEFISDDVSRTVFDKTGFTATFDVHLDFVPSGAIMHTGPYPSAGAARGATQGRPQPPPNSVRANQSSLPCRDSWASSYYPPRGRFHCSSSITPNGPLKIDALSRLTSFVQRGSNFR